LVVIALVVSCGSSTEDPPRPARNAEADRCAVAGGRCECEALPRCAYLSNCDPRSPTCEQGTTALGAAGDECHSVTETACTTDNQCPEGMRCRDLYAVDLTCSGTSTMKDPVKVRRCTSAPLKP
jgi:hypothetical protein